jgi:CHASE3 domain sensor protein
MRNALRTTVSIVLTFLSLMALLSYTGNYDSKQHAAAAQLTTQNPFANNTETIADLENVLGDQNTHIILNGTNIANPNNTLPDSININIKEDCMQLPNSVHMYCP